MCNIILFALMVALAAFIVWAILTNNQTAEDEREIRLTDDWFKPMTKSYGNINHIRNYRG